MCFLRGKRILIFGMSNKFSIGFGIAKSMFTQGANLAFTYQNLKFKNRVLKLALKLNSNIVLPCDVSLNKNIYTLFKNLSNIWKNFDGFVHCIGFTPKKTLQKNYLNCITKRSFNITHNITSYSFAAILKACKNMLNINSSVLTISFIGSVQVVPFYNIMGAAKASLEANVRYLASDLGKNKIRVNAISAPPIKTFSSSRIKGFDKLFYRNKEKNILKKNITIYDIGNVAAFLCSNLSLGITGQIIYVDGGYNTIY